VVDNVACSWERLSVTYILINKQNKIIDSLKSKDSSGYDVISTKFIKISKSFIISPLINICNKMVA
jgi:hypothetical protein